MLLVVAVLTPLTIYGILSINNARRALKESIEQSHREISLRTASEIKLYLNNAEDLFNTLAEDLANTNLTAEQAKRIIDNYVIRFPQFQKILQYSEGLAIAYTTSLDKEDQDIPSKGLISEAAKGRPIFSQAYLSDDLTPVLWYLLPLKEKGKINGVLAAQIDLMKMWDWVSSTKLGKEGYVSVVDRNGAVVASGDPHYKKAILSSEEPVVFAGIGSALGSNDTRIMETPRGKALISSSPVSDSPPWFTVLSQPTAEAFAAFRTMTIELVALIFVFLILVIIAAAVGSRRALLNPVHELLKATHALGKGDLEYRIPELGRDELGQLGGQFNQMIQELAELQETTKRQERFSMFGRIASGLAHDLKHPVKNIENAAKLMETMYQDESYRETFTRIVQREFSRINQFLDDLRNLTHEMSFQPACFDLIALLKEIQESFQAEAKKKSLDLKVDSAEAELSVVGDPSLLRRAFENLVSNAIQAMPNGRAGRVVIGVAREGREISAKVSDTGPGIPEENLINLFDEFMTTKGRGLGLGLAITRKILLLHQGHISVESEVGVGTTFQMRWLQLAG